MSDLDLSELAERVAAAENKLEEQRQRHEQELEEERQQRQRLEQELEEERQQRQRLEQELEEERQQRQRLEHRVEQQEELIEDRTPEDEKEEDGSNFSDLWLADVPVGRIINRTKARVDTIEDQLDDGQPDAATELAEDAPPIYTLVKTPPERLKPTERRTRFLWSDLSDYAKRTPTGYVLPASDARRVLEAAEPEDSDATRIDPNHVGRVFELSKDLTRGAAWVRRTDGERQLIVPTDWEDQARQAAGDGVVT